MKTFRQNAKYVMGLGVLLCVFSFIQWTGNGVSTGVAAAVAQITDETISSEENAVLDKNGPHMRRAMDTQTRHTHTLMEMPDVVGTATGLTANNSPTILVFTKQEMKAGAIPEYLEGIPVTIKVTGEIFALREQSNGAGGNVKPTSKFSMPVPIGVSTGNAGECSAGTIGARVKDTSGNVYALSNNHVYALENGAPIGSTILQPGLYDTHCIPGQSNVIGKLYHYIPINFTGGKNIVDAAIASSSMAQLDNSTPSSGYGQPNSRTYTQEPGNPPLIGQSVMKYGRTTRLTTGTVNGVNVTLNVCYNSSCSLIATFTDQIAIGSNNFSRAGDSGSLIVSNDANANAYPIGLLFAGGGGITFANPIDAVLNSLNVSIDGK